MDHAYNIFTLANGLRVVSRRTNGLVSYIGAVINAGSRDEAGDCHGLAHFVEHTIFKGTLSRRSWQISARLEVVGGELNAYTSKEETVVYTNAPSGYEERAVELLADILTASCFPKAELDREREVVEEEINSYLDSPSESVYDEFEEMAYAGSCLSHNILGSPESVKKLTGEDCRGFLDRYYTPGNMVVYCSSPLPPERVERLVSRYFSCMSFPDRGHNRIVPPPMEPFDLRRDRGNHQANTIVGARVFGRQDPRRYALFLLNNYLGGPCMNSRLNRELRERRGYVYTVDSSVGLLSDSGLLIIYFGSDPSTVGKCRRIIAGELDRLAQSSLSAATFERIKRQYCGQLLVSSDNIESRSISMGKSLLYYDRINDISTTADRIMAVTAEEMRQVAELLSPDKCACLTLI